MPYTVKIKKLNGNEDIHLPHRASSEASGFDLHAAVTEPVLINPGDRQLIPTGIAIAMPEQLEAQIRPRSGLAWKHGITVLNTPGTIDADYRGEIKVILINLGQDPFVVRRNDRIAQMVFQKVPSIRLEESSELPDTIRGESGFGHTGI